MKVSYYLLGAAIAVPLAGALVGTRVGTDPTGGYEDFSAVLPDNPIAVDHNSGPQTRERLPDHYALETPEGRVDVADLARRGRHADRYRAIEARDAAFKAELAARDAYEVDMRAGSLKAVNLDAQQPQFVRANHHAPAQRVAPQYAGSEGEYTGRNTAVSSASGSANAPAPLTSDVTDLSVRSQAKHPQTMASRSNSGPLPRIIDVGAVLASQ